MNDTTTDLKEAFAELRTFLHTQTPNEATRGKLFKMLEQAYNKHKEIYLDEWFPYVQGVGVWLDEPLYHVSLEGMSDGMMWTTLHSHTTTIETYKSVVPDRPLYLRIGGANYHTDTPSPRLWSYNTSNLAELLDHVVGLCIDRPQWGWDDGQNGHGQGDANIALVFSGVEKHLSPYLNNLQHIKICTARDTDFSVTLPDSENYGSAPGNIARLSNTYRLDTLFSEQPTMVSFQLSSYLRPGDIDNISKWTWWTTLQRLNLSGNQIRQGGIKKLFSAPMPSLHTLNLSRNPKFGVGGVKALAKSTSFPALEHIDLTNCGVTQEDLSVLTDSKHFPNLQTVDV